MTGNWMLLLLNNRDVIMWLTSPKCRHFFKYCPLNGYNCASCHTVASPNVSTSITLTMQSQTKQTVSHGQEWHEHEAYIFVGDFPEIKGPKDSKEHEGCARDDESYCSDPPNPTYSAGLQSKNTMISKTIVKMEKKCVLRREVKYFRYHIWLPNHYAA